MNATSDLDLQPTLVGETISLRPLHTEDFEPLYAAAADPLIWEQHPEPLRYQRPVFEGFFASALASGGALVAIDQRSGTVIGSSRYYDWNPAAKEVTIGYTFLARNHWGGATNREMKHLMLSHAFLRANAVWFHIGSSNFRSRKAMEKIGGKLSHEASVEANGVAHDYAFYRIEAPWQAGAATKTC